MRLPSKDGTMPLHVWRWPDSVKHISIETWARWAAALLLTACAVYVYFRRYDQLQAMIQDSGLLHVWFWDAKVFSNAGQHVATGIDPYRELSVDIPYHSLPFISAPIVARTLGALYSLFGPYLNPLLQLAHVVAIVLTPLIASRLFLGKAWSDAALGYGLFLCGIGAFGVTTVIAGNFGAVLYLAIFAALAHGLTRKNWFWYHVALIVAVQVKFPYALFWIVPVLVNGWSWRQFRDSATAGLVAILILTVSSALDPVFFHNWMVALETQVNTTGDLGFSVFGVTRWMIGLDSPSVIPYLAHIAVCAPLLVFLILEPTRGPMKAAALLAFATLANPRMKEYDIAFMTIPAAALLLHAFASFAPPRHRNAVALGMLVVWMLVALKIDRVPFIDAYVMPFTLAAAILSLAVVRRRAGGKSYAPPIRIFRDRAV